MGGIGGQVVMTLFVKSIYLTIAGKLKKHQRLKRWMNKMNQYLCYHCGCKLEYVKFSLTTQLGKTYEVCSECMKTLYKLTSPTPNDEVDLN